MVAADEDRPERVRLETPQPVIAEHALCFKISDHRGRSRQLQWRATIGPIEAHYPNHPGTPGVVSEYSKIAYQVTRGGGAGVPAPVIEGADLIHPLEPVVADSSRSAPSFRKVPVSSKTARLVGTGLSADPASSLA
jgi:hypothetical protein